jgi:exonuclease VII small subunit
MNNDRRKAIDEVVAKLNAAKAELDDVATDERMSFDDMPESIQESERGEKMSECADNLETAASELETLIEEIEALTE